MLPSELMTAVRAAIEAIPTPEGVTDGDKLQASISPSRVRKPGRMVAIGVDGSVRVPGRLVCAKPLHVVTLGFVSTYPKNAAGLARAADDAALLAEMLAELPLTNTDIASVIPEAGVIDEFDDSTISSERLARVQYRYGA